MELLDKRQVAQQPESLWRSRFAWHRNRWSPVSKDYWEYVLGLESKLPPAANEANQFPGLVRFGTDGSGACVRFSSALTGPGALSSLLPLPSLSWKSGAEVV